MSVTRITLCRALASSGSRHCPSRSKPCDGPPILVAQKKPSSPGASSCVVTRGVCSTREGSRQAATAAGGRPSSCLAPTGLVYRHSEKRPESTAPTMASTVASMGSRGTGAPLKVLVMEVMPSERERSGMASSASSAATTAGHVAFDDLLGAPISEQNSCTIAASYLWLPAAAAPSAANILASASIRSRDSAWRFADL